MKYTEFHVLGSKTGTQILVSEIYKISRCHVGKLAPNSLYVIYMMLITSHRKT